MKDLVERYVVEKSKRDVHMIRHDRPRVKQVTLSVEETDRTIDDLRDPFVFEPASAIAAIEKSISQNVRPAAERNSFGEAL